MWNHSATAAMWAAVPTVHRTTKTDDGDLESAPPDDESSFPNSSVINMASNTLSVFEAGWPTSDDAPNCLCTDPGLCKAVTGHKQQNVFAFFIN